MATLNLANEFLKAKNSDEELQSIVGLRIRTMRERLDSTAGFTGLPALGVGRG